MRPAVAFRRRARRAIADPVLQSALDNNAAIRRDVWGPAFASLPDGVHVREQAAAIRREVVTNLREYVEEFIHNLSANGIKVHLASSAQEARRIILGIAEEVHPQYAVKSKSMLTEEIGLNEAFLQAGIHPLETDLGEYIVQLRGEKPSHIITPAVHLRREQVAETFTQHLEIPHTTDVAVMTGAVRQRMREQFLGASLAVTGVNFGVVATGTLCLLENEGNIRMTATLPPVHIAVMGLERLVPDLNSLTVMLQVLPRAATGQSLTSYVSWINAPASASDMDGPLQRHLVLVDNGRLEMADSLLSEALMCIRCGACLNACPVFQEIGGASYGSPYPGPIGSLVSPSLFGVADFGHLAKASTLCGACTDACPVGIDFPKLLQRRRVEFVQTVRQPFWLRLGLRLYTYVCASASRFRRMQTWAARFGRLLPRRRGWLTWLPGPLSGWTNRRHFPIPANRPFRDRWLEMMPTPREYPHLVSTSEPTETAPAEPTQPHLDLGEIFADRLQAVDGEFQIVERRDLVKRITAILSEAKDSRILVSPLEMLGYESVLADLEAAGIVSMVPELPPDVSERRERLSELADVPVGLTRAAAALADTGTLVQPGGPGRSLLASMLPEIHIAVLSMEDIYPDMAAWLAGGGEFLAQQSPNMAFITGPSRTADIEMTLTIGVHGPRRVVVLGVKD